MMAYHAELNEQFDVLLLLIIRSLYICIALLFPAVCGPVDVSSCALLVSASIVTDTTIIVYLHYPIPPVVSGPVDVWSTALPITRLLAVTREPYNMHRVRTHLAALFIDTSQPVSSQTLQKNTSLYAAAWNNNHWLYFVLI